MCHVSGDLSRDHEENTGAESGLQVTESHAAGLAE